MADFADSWKAMMQSGKIVVYAHVYDQADLLRDYIDWYLDLGVDLLLVKDNGSTDGSHDVLDEYARRGHVNAKPCIQPHEERVVGSGKSQGYGDVVEVAPAYDCSDITSLLAATLVFEIAALIAIGRTG